MRAVVERADGRYLVWVGPELTARDISGSEAEANARLIAAAPDLLAAARAVLAAWEAGDLAAATRQLTDAIARAEGHPATLRCTRCGHVADIATSETFRATSWTCPHCQPTAAKAGAK
jgi:lipopolysaccharide biosynthesis regulator YciM